MQIHRQLEEHNKTVGLTINATKINVMIQSRRDLSRQQIEIRSQVTQKR
jgi:hypothetical protein